MRRRLDDLLPFDSPLFDLVRRVQEEGHSVSDYGVDLPFNRGAPRLVDLHVSAAPRCRATSSWYCIRARSRAGSITS